MHVSLACIVTRALCAMLSSFRRRLHVYMNVNTTAATTDTLMQRCHLKCMRRKNLFLTNNRSQERHADSFASFKRNRIYISLSTSWNVMSVMRETHRTKHASGSCCLFAIEHLSLLLKHLTGKLVLTSIGSHE